MVPDREMQYYGDRFTQACLESLDREPLPERLKIELSIRGMVDRIREMDPHTFITYEDGLSLVMSTFYYNRFHQSPVQTAIFTREERINENDEK